MLQALRPADAPFRRPVPVTARSIVVTALAALLTLAAAGLLVVPST